MAVRWPVVMAARSTTGGRLAASIGPAEGVVCRTGAVRAGGLRSLRTSVLGNRFSVDLY